MSKAPTKPRFVEIGERLLLTRLATGLSQTKFATTAGLKQNLYNMLERGVQRPGLDAAIKIVVTHHCTLDWIYLGDEGSLRVDLLRKIREIKAERDTT